MIKLYLIHYIVNYILSTEKLKTKNIMLVIHLAVYIKCCFSYKIVIKSMRFFVEMVQLLLSFIINYHKTQRRPKSSGIGLTGASVVPCKLSNTSM